MAIAQVRASGRLREIADLAKMAHEDWVMLLPEYWSTCKDAVFAALEKATEGKDS